MSVEKCIETYDLIINEEYDVVVAGGGIAGIAAAIAAARSGMKVLIIEKSVKFGGLAVLGFVNKYLPLCDGNGVKVTAGIAQELLYISIKHGYNNLANEWAIQKSDIIKSPKRYETVFSPPEFSIALDEIIEEQGIQVLFDTLVCRPHMKNGKCEYISAESKEGRTFYKARMYIDATGEADLMVRAGCDYEDADNWLTYWAYYTSLDDMEKGLATADIKKGVRLWELGGTADGKNAPKGYPKYRGSNATEITRFVLDGRRILKVKMQETNKKAFNITALPDMPQFRTTRRIKGMYELSIEDINKRSDESIGCTADWRTGGKVYEIPYSCLIAPDVSNIIAAGRCISSGGDAWEVTRAIPGCAVTGEAAGIVAALAIKKDAGVHDIPIKELQSTLKDNGVILHR